MSGVDWTHYLDDIARGVEIRLELLSGHAITIIEETIAIARSLGVPEDQIDKWANARKKQNSEKINGMNSLLEKLKRNLIAQVVLGITKPYRRDSNANSHLS